MTATADRMENRAPCPCGKPLSVNECCGRFFDESSWPDTAEELMRSRYTAFATQHIDYIFTTHHPDTRSEVNRGDVERFSRDSTWLGLEILSTEDGQPGDDQGWVEFCARYADKQGEHLHHERSLFRREKGRWFFHSAHAPKGTPIRHAQPKVGRNEPCPCGSGKKHKKCCGAAAA